MAERDDRKPCRGQNANICVGEGCYDEACLRTGADRLTEAEWEALGRAARSTGIGVSDLQMVAVRAAVESILAARAAAVRAEHGERIAQAILALDPSSDILQHVARIALNINTTGEDK